MSKGLILGLISWAAAQTRGKNGLTLLLVTQDLRFFTFLVGRTGGGASRCTSAARLEQRRAAGSDRATGRQSGYPPSEEQPRREVAGSLRQWEL